MADGIISNYRTLPMGKYEEICKISKSEDLDDLGKQVQIIAVLSGCTEEEVLNLPIQEYARRAGLTLFLERPTKEDRVRVAKNYLIGGMELIPTSDYRRITTAQYIDFQNYTKDGEERVVEVLSCFLIPKGCKYNQGYDPAEVQKAIREELSVSDVLALCAFFLKKYETLIRSSLIYCKREAKKLPKEKREIIAKKLAPLETLLSVGGGSLT